MGVYERSVYKYSREIFRKVMPKRKYNRLTIIKEVEPEERKDGRGFRKKVLCRCDCGVEKILHLSSVKAGNVKSCGCLRFGRKNAQTHGLGSHPLNSRWQTIKQRCYNVNHKEWRRYGGRGITMCKEWRDDFVAFYDWCLTNGYEQHLSIDRKNNDKGYTPENCRFVDGSTNSNNTRSNHLVLYRGEVLTVMELCKKLGIEDRYSTVRQRIKKYGYSIEDAVILKTNDNKKQNLQAAK